MPPVEPHSYTLKLHRTSGFGEVSNTGPDLEIIADRALSSSGTFIALGKLALGVTANSVDQPPAQGHNRRGGARNQSNRTSFSLTALQVTNIKAAVHHSQVIGLPLNRMVTVHWQSAGITLESMAKATGHFIDLLSKAIMRHGGRTAWIWVHENGSGKGGHCHLLVHVPPDLAELISRSQRSWLRRITGKPYKSRVILSKPIGGRLRLETGNPALHAHNLDTALGYLLKGADPEMADRLELTRQEPGGHVIGKRCGVSQNIGPKAR
jgi:hypothetical protein